MGKSDGNVLFIVLIGIALFAALSYAVTSSDRGSRTTDQETLLLDVSQIIQHAVNIRHVISRMRSINGCTDADISFENSEVAGYINASSPADNSCHIFDSNGGHIPWTKPPIGVNDGSDWLYTGSVRIYDLGGVGGTPELLMILPNVTLAACIEINNRFGIPNPSGAPPRGLSSLAQNKFTGAYTTVDGIGALDTEVRDESSSCFEETLTSKYDFVSTIIVR